MPELTRVDATLQTLVLGSLAGSGLPAGALEAVADAYGRAEGVTAAEVDAVVDAAVAAAPEGRRTEVRAVLERRLVATALIDLDLTEAVRAAAAAAITPVLRSLEAGQVIVQEGEVLTVEMLGTLEAVGLYAPRFAAFGRSVWIVFGALLLGGLTALPLGYALRHLSDRHRTGPESTRWSCSRS